MSTWLDQWDRRYTDRVRLLVEILPVLAQELRFALKGGTAITLFEHDLPRLSVDIDLAWLPVHEYAEDAKLIAEALGRLADVLRACQAHRGAEGSARAAGESGRTVPADWPAIADGLDEWEAIATRQQDALRRSDEPECAPPVVLMALSADDDTREEVRRQVRHRLKN